MHGLAGRGRSELPRVNIQRVMRSVGQIAAEFGGGLVFAIGAPKISRQDANTIASRIVDLFVVSRDGVGLG